MSDITQDTLEMLYKMLKHTKISIAHAEHRNARQDEMENLHRKVQILDHLIELTLKEDVAREH